MTALLAVAVVCPLFLAALLFVRGALGTAARALAPWAALPVLLLALFPAAYGPLALRWLQTGALLELDAVGRIFLIVAAALWTAAGVYARGYIPEEERRRYFLFHLAAMSGNLALPLAADAVTFFLAFALMTFAAFGLVVHTDDAPAWRAGRAYIVLAVVGEAFLLVGLVLAVGAAGTTALADIPAAVAASPHRNTLLAALLIGFGIKAGAVPLHVWLPLAHPVAPVPASAVLSGAMIKAGLLGWLRFLPLGEAALPEWGTFVIVLGAVAAFFGVAIGMVQREPKTVLAYSSVSQMGVLNVGIGIALAAPQAYPAAVAAVTLYAAHHGLAKGALFLGAGMARKAGSGSRGKAVRAALLLPALAVAGAPLTSGSAAKGELKTLVPFSPDPWPLWLEWMLPLSAFATTLLMARFLALVSRAAEDAPEGRLARRLWVPWAGLLAGVLTAVWLMPRGYPVGGSVAPSPGFDTLLLDVLPIVAGLLVFRLLSARLDGVPVREDDVRHWLAPGDLLNPLERGMAHLASRWTPPAPRGPDPVTVIASRWYRIYAESARSDLSLRLEVSMTRWPAAMIIVLLMIAIFAVAMARSG